MEIVVFVIILFIVVDVILAKIISAANDAISDYASAWTSLIITLLTGAGVLYFVFLSPIKGTKWCGLVNLLGLYFLMVGAWIKQDRSGGECVFLPLCIIPFVGLPVSIPIFASEEGWLSKDLFIAYAVVIGIFLIVSITKFFAAESYSDRASRRPASVSSSGGGYYDSRSEYERDKEKIHNASGADRIKAIKEFEEKYPWPPTD